MLISDLIIALVFTIGAGAILFLAETKIADWQIKTKK